MLEINDVYCEDFQGFENLEGLAVSAMSCGNHRIHLITKITVQTNAVKLDDSKKENVEEVLLGLESS